ncbi:MAG: hypothetical protein ABI026_01850, partial [Gemmatimonadaceae bacterium]
MRTVHLLRRGNGSRKALTACSNLIAGNSSKHMGYMMRTLRTTMQLAAAAALVAAAVPMSA